MAGLASAWLLRDRFDITLYEAHPRPGMGAFTAELEYEGQAVQVDVPTRVFTSGYYPNLEALLELIDVRLEATDHAGAYASGNGDLRLQYANRRFLGRPWHYLAWPTVVQPRSWMLLRDARRFLKRADQDLSLIHI